MNDPFIADHNHHMLYREVRHEALQLSQGVAKIQRKLRTLHKLHKTKAFKAQRPSPEQGGDSGGAILMGILILCVATYVVKKEAKRSEKAKTDVASEVAPGVAPKSAPTPIMKKEVVSERERKLLAESTERGWVGHLNHALFIGSLYWTSWKVTLGVLVLCNMLVAAVADNFELIRNNYWEHTKQGANDATV